MKKITVLALYLSSLSLYSSNRPSLQELKNGSYTASQKDTMSDDDFDDFYYSTFDEINNLEEKGSASMNQALEKLSRRKHDSDIQKRNSRERINK